MESIAACLGRNYSNYITCETVLKVKHALTDNRSAFVQFKSVGWRWELSANRKGDCFEVTLSSYSCTEMAFVRLSIINSDDLKTCVPKDEIVRYKSRQVVASIKLQELQDDPKLLHDGELWLHCEVATKDQFGKPPTMKILADKLKFRLPVNADGKDLATLLAKHEKLSDVIISVAGNEIKAHKAFLALRSTVFKAMFSKEGQNQNRVVISDVDYEVVEQMLLFIYTGKAPKLDEMADRLMMAAEKYSIGALKVICQQQLSSTITIDAVIQLKTLAGQCNANLLQDKLNEFVKKNYKELMSSPSWQKSLYEAAYKQQ